MSTNVVSVRLDQDLKDQLDALSARTGRPAAFYVRAALKDRLDDLEWAYDLAATAEGIRRGTTPTRPIEDLMAELDVTQTDLDAMPSTTE